ncbi:hypothetical protein GUITHDRAFT_139978 [Guillardia theta CCMP2712]|uniref:Uncharacterized protein n=1 Tax=Guillardia theta (strain CCMP2712) TaxID=905079 RepID=L1J7P7_GUITC|nr:hypothetical protein GUITHDRAFT_139978 [Guillardia theta CCMP2712]EKX44129.1 hypothetical protein GUITHDRAFT_139978 [Guillardia theta CCMP2712]|eukprot:XP_005831109.1 hypothetical protein GUITHDRAFT_139978 [Guillardia theta CCMP2712]
MKRSIFAIISLFLAREEDHDLMTHQRDPLFEMDPAKREKFEAALRQIFPRLHATRPHPTRRPQFKEFWSEILKLRAESLNQLVFVARFHTQEHQNIDAICGCEDLNEDAQTVLEQWINQHSQSTWSEFLNERQPEVDIDTRETGTRWVDLMMRLAEREEVDTSLLDGELNLDCEMEHHKIAHENLGREENQAQAEADALEQLKCTLIKHRNEIEQRVRAAVFLFKKIESGECVDLFIEIYMARGIKQVFEKYCRGLQVIDPKDPNLTFIRTRSCCPTSSNKKERTDFTCLDAKCTLESLHRLNMEGVKYVQVYLVETGEKNGQKNQNFTTKDRKIIHPCFVDKCVRRYKVEQGCDIGIIVKVLPNHLDDSDSPPLYFTESSGTSLQLGESVMTKKIDMRGKTEVNACITHSGDLEILQIQLQTV